MFIKHVYESNILRPHEKQQQEQIRHLDLMYFIMKLLYHVHRYVCVK